MTQTYGDGSLPFLAALGEHAKQYPKRRYRNLYKTMCRTDVLQRAWAQAAANDGAAGVDGIGFAAIPLSLALPSGRCERPSLGGRAAEGFSGKAFGPVMATFHRAAEDRRGALSERYCL